MKYSEYEKAFSPARLNKYLKACGGDSAAALTLYRHNIKFTVKQIVFRHKCTIL